MQLITQQHRIVCCKMLRTYLTQSDAVLRRSVMLPAISEVAPKSNNALCIVYTVGVVQARTDDARGIGTHNADISIAYCDATVAAVAPKVCCRHI